MHFQTITEFMLMGKHGVYVWSSWGIVLAVVVGLIIHARRQRKALIKELLARQKRKTNH